MKTNESKMIGRTLRNTLVCIALALPISNTVIGYGVTYVGLNGETPEKGREIAGRVVNTYETLPNLEKVVFAGNYLASKQYLGSF